MKALHTEPGFPDAVDLPAVRIEPPRRWPSFGLGELWAYRELLYYLVWRDVKVRYKQSAIGVGWAVIQPLLTMVVFTVVFGSWAELDSDGLPYELFNFAALLPWLLFSKGLTQSILSVVANAHLVTKIYFPRLLLPIAGVLPGVVEFGIAFVLFLGMLAWYGVLPGWGVLLLPLLVLLAICAALSVSLWLSVINVKYRDVGQAVPFLVQLGMFASPVAYSLNIIPERWLLLYSLNPMVGIIQGFRWALLGAESPAMVPLLMSVAIVLALLVAGVAYFKRMESTFADIV